jgi:hypothetical protein
MAITTDNLKNLKDGDFTIFYYQGEELFRYSHVIASDFKQTPEEFALGIELCLKARIEGGWKGDILSRG